METRPVELKAIDAVREDDGDFKYLQGSDDFKIDAAHYSVSKVYALSLKIPALFNAIKELKAEGFEVEPQMDNANEKFILLVTRTVSSSGKNDEIPGQAEEQ